MLILVGLIVFRSTSRGSVMERMAEAVPGGSELLRLFRGTRSKKVFLYQSRHRTGQATAQTTTDTQQTSNQAARSGGSPLRSRTRSRSSSPAVEVSHNDDNEDEDLPEMIGRGEDPSTSTSEPTRTAAGTTSAINLQLPDPQLPIVWTISDDEGEERGMSEGYALSVHGDGDDINTDISTTGLATSTQVVVDLDINKCHEVGEIKKNLAMEKDICDHSGISMTIKCEEELREACKGNVAGMPTFVPTSFDELCLQARELVKGVIVLILSPSCNSRNATISALKKVSHLYGNSCLFWLQKSNSIDGKEVQRRFCSNLRPDGREDQIHVFGPGIEGLHPNHICCYEGVALRTLKDQDLMNKLKIIKGLCLMISGERRQLVESREEKKQQDREYVEMEKQEKEKVEKKSKELEERKRKEKEKEEDKRREEKEEERRREEQKKIRQARRQRLGAEPTETGDHVLQIIVQTAGGRMTRKFKKGGHYQEVYDWVGSEDDCPLFFCLTSYNNAIMRMETIIDGGGALYQKELSKEEAEDIFGNEVSFFGNYQFQNTTMEQTVDAGMQADENSDVQPGEADKKKKKRGQRKKIRME